MKKLLTLSALLMLGTSAFADDVQVSEMRCAGPFPVHAPVMIDSKNVNSVEYSKSVLLDSPINLDAVNDGAIITNGILPSDANAASISLAGFTIANSIFTSATISVDGVGGDYRLYVDGKQITGGYVQLQPSVHKVVVKCMTEAGSSDTLTVKVDADKCTLGMIGGGAKRTYNFSDVLHAQQYTAANISPDGKYLISSTYMQNTSGSEVRKNYLWNLSTGAKQQITPTRWMPRTSKMLLTRKNDGLPGYTLLAIDPVTLAETELAANLPESRFTMSPTEDFVIYSVQTEGPKEDKGVFEVVTPDDRQPGWRNRTNLYKYDFKSGLAYPLTYGYHNVYLNDISQDGQYALIMKSEYDASQMRPTDFNTLYRLNLSTMQVDTLISHDGFISSASFSPDGKQVVVSGSPEALGGIGLNVAPGQTPSNYDAQLFLIDLAERLQSGNGIYPLTKDFNPSVQSFDWSFTDGMLYFSAENKDCEHLFRLNPKTRKIQYIPVPEEIFQRYSISAKTGTLAYYAQSAANGDRLYTLNLKSLKSTLIEDLCKKDLADVELGEYHPYTWVNADGDSICCTYYLPPYFDASKQYPMIVNYYGGCSPTSRTFGGRYAKQAYSALGYIVLVINPRGATGFGQKWSAMHVNTAGKYVADDIIGTVKAFTAEHPYVNAKKIGCIGASYGGFMTQYLQTQTDIFAAAVSHAGISDHTSYWGEGYWGYSYSQTSMANSYPWTRKDLYVDQSPLFNADKIHTPLLFVHGTGDTNVPVGESIQMYTALKLLGRPTAMVLVEGENHWITEYHKRIKWQNTIWAWFAKWLQDDDSWWNSMYKDKDL
ncbi:MAG: S9 family peptidase [Prevotellaceae bacterium]|nr:S9 family peptidase [Candidatus Minthosoma caballi]